MKIWIINVLIFSFLVSISYGGELKVKDQKKFYTDKTVQRLEDISEKLKSKYKNVIISEQEAIKIAKEYLQNKEYDYTYDSKSKTSTEFLKNGNYEYNYEIDWDHPRIRLEQKALKKDGSLTGGFGAKVLVWHVWFLPLDGIDLEGKRDVVGVDIDAKTGKVFTKYSWSKI